MDNYSGLMQHRSEAATRKSISSSERRSLFLDEVLEKSSSTASDSQMIFQRRTTEVRVAFEDFVMINIIGKGTFGKVYLVQNKHTEQLYAMKSIRKDIVIEHDSLENLHLEKQILNQVNHPFIISMDFVFIKDFRIYFIMDFIQ